MKINAWHIYIYLVTLYIAFLIGRGYQRAADRERTGRITFEPRPKIPTRWEER